MKDYSKQAIIIGIFAFIAGYGLLYLVGDLYIWYVPIFIALIVFCTAHLSGKIGHLLETISAEHKNEAQRKAEAEALLKEKGLPLGWETLNPGGPLPDDWDGWKDKK